MANTDKKRRTEKDLKELWQYIDAKYFLKFNKNELISKIDQILREIMLQNQTNLSANRRGIRANGPGDGARLSQVQTNKGRTLRRNPQRESETALDTQESSGLSDRVSKYRTYAQMACREDSIFSFENLDEKGFRQLYSDTLEKLEVITDWKTNIDKDSKNVDYLEQLEKNIMSAKIRNIFDVEFNKKFQGSLSIPMIRNSSIGHSSRQHSSHGTSAAGANKYLFFITDKYISEKQIEEVERDNLQEQHEQERSHKLKQLRGIDIIEPNPEQQNQIMSEKRQSEGQGLTLGFMNVETVDSENQNKLQRKKSDFSFVQEQDSSKSYANNKSGSKQQGKKGKLGRETTLEEELNNLEQEYLETKEQINQDTNQLKNKLSNYKEPEALQILESKIDKERTYLQNSIIKIEIKQIAESITKVTHAKKMSQSPERKSSYADMVLEKYGPPIARKTRHMIQTDTRKSPSSSQEAKKCQLKSDNSKDKVSRDNIGVQNRPQLLVRQLAYQLSIEQAKKSGNQSVQRSGKKGQNSSLKNGSSVKVNQNSQAKSITDHLFRLEFDQTCGIPPCWVDTQTLNYFNTLRDNIFASSSHYDRFLPSSQQNKNKAKSQRKMGPNETIKDKNSVAFQRGKRSCTLSDITNYKSTSILNQLSNQSQVQSGKKTVSSLNTGLKADLLQQAQGLIANQKQPYDDYDFCHHCKQLKSKYLLVSCKYSSKNNAHLKPPHAPFTPYPYEPQCYSVNNVKIHNVDHQNRSQIRGLIENIKKDLKLKNQAIESTKQQMQHYIKREEVSEGIKLSNGEYTSAMLDIAAFQQNNQQLITWIQDQDINPYTLDPYSQSQLVTDPKQLFPNLYPVLYPSQLNSGQHKNNSNNQTSQTKKGSLKEGAIEYECKRKFCTFCLRTNYEDNINDIVRNKNWHCHHCTGYCICTRCQRQDITTQLKAYLISLGGNLNILRDQSHSIFDELLLKNFNEHLELTLGQNQHLYKKFPYYLKMLMGYDFEDPCNSVIKFNDFSKSLALQKGTSTPSFNKSTSNLMSSGRNLSPSKQNSLGFMSKTDENVVNDDENDLQGSRINSFLTKSQQKESEKIALGLLFRYSMLNQKVDDQNGLNSGQDRKYLDQISKSIQRHDQEVVIKIQKRRGRKKFILSNEDYSSQDSIYATSLNKRDQKYLEKIIQMSDQPIFSQEAKRFQPLVNGDLLEFSTDWPRNQQNSLTNISKLMQQYSLDQNSRDAFDDGSHLSNEVEMTYSRKKQNRKQMMEKNNRLGVKRSNRKRGKCLRLKSVTKAARK